MDTAHIITLWEGIKRHFYKSTEILLDEKPDLIDARSFYKQHNNTRYETRKLITLTSNEHIWISNITRSGKLIFRPKNLHRA